MMCFCELNFLKKPHQTPRILVLRATPEVTAAAALASINGTDVETIIILDVHKHHTGANWTTKKHNKNLSTSLRSLSLCFIKCFYIFLISSYQRFSAQHDVFSIFVRTRSRLFSSFFFTLLLLLLRFFFYRYEYYHSTLSLLTLAKFDSYVYVLL